MTNSLRKIDARIDEPDNVESPPKPGSQASHAELSGTVGGPTEVTPRQFTASDVLQSLADAVADLEAAGKTATAAGVSARMRKANPDFSPENAGFATFREITQAAEAAGLITSTKTKSDYVLKVARVEDFRGLTLRPDLWRAIQDWTDGVAYAFSRSTRKTEPMGATLPAGAVRVPSVDKSASIRWMQEFAPEQGGDIGVRLVAALEEADPVVSFFRAVRQNDGAKRRWARYHRERVLGVAVEWASANGIPRTDIFSPSVRPRTETDVAVSPVGSVGDGAGPDERRRVLGILESMPLYELLRLPIPLEYALKR